MNSRFGKAAVLAGVMVLLGAGLFLLGRNSNDPEPARIAGYTQGQSDGYLAGLRAGEARGEQAGRALQEGIALPPDAQQPVQDAFNAGYVAGANSAFSQYDGGWGLGEPYVVTVEAGESPIAYRFSSRTTMKASTNYYLCADGTALCQEAR